MSRYLLALAALAATSLGHAQNLAPELPGFDGLTERLQPQEAQTWRLAKTARCQQYLKFNSRLNPDRYLASCEVESLEIEDLERIAAATRARRGDCAQVARLKVEDLRNRELFEVQPGRFPEDQSRRVDYGIFWKFEFGTGRQELKLRTPVASHRRTLSRGQSLGGAGGPVRRSGHPLVSRAEGIRHEVSQAAGAFDLPALRGQLTAENFGTLGEYSALRSLERSTRRESTLFERRAREAFVDQGDCERYWDEHQRAVNAELGSRRSNG